MKPFVYISIMLLLMAGCRDNKKYATLTEKEWSVDTICYLQENIDLVGEINSIGRFDDNHFLLSTKVDPAVYLYDLSGTQLLKIDRPGRAKYEYINPAIVRADTDGNIYVWCDMTLKMIVFDKFGQPLDEIPYMKSIRNFVPYRNYICFYLSGSYDTTVEVYDRIEDDIVFSQREAPSQEHILLSMNESSGGMALLGDDLLFSYADGPSVHAINLNDFVETERTVEIPDSDFRVRPINGDAREFFNQDRYKALKYLSENSMVNGMYVTQDNIFILATTGSYEIHSDYSITNDNLMTKLWVLDHNFNYLYSISRKYSYYTKGKWFFSDQNSLLYVELANSSSEGLNYALCRVRIS
jgi:hypothetical protein